MFDAVSVSRYSVLGEMLVKGMSRWTKYDGMSSGELRSDIPHVATCQVAGKIKAGVR